MASAKIFSWYREELSDCNQISLNPDIAGLFNSYWMTTALLEPETLLDKKILVPRMRERGVDVRPFFFPLSEIPALRDSPMPCVRAVEHGGTAAQSLRH